LVSTVNFEYLVCAGGLIVFNRSQFVHIWQLSGQFVGAVNENREMLGANSMFAAFIKENNQGNLAVISSAMDTMLGFGHFLPQLINWILVGGMVHFLIN
jgi:hypothetical protein